MTSSSSPSIFFKGGISGCVGGSFHRTALKHIDQHWQPWVFTRFNGLGFLKKILAGIVLANRKVLFRFPARTRPHDVAGFFRLFGSNRTIQKKRA